MKGFDSERLQENRQWSSLVGDLLEEGSLVGIFLVGNLLVGGLPVKTFAIGDSPVNIFQWRISAVHWTL